MNSGVKVLFGLFTFAAALLGILAVAREHPDLVQQFLKWALYIGIGVVALAALAAIIAAIKGNPALLIILVTIGGCIAVAVFIAVEYVPRTSREVLAAVFAIATVIGLVVGVVLLNGVASRSDR
jgi:hypothetical protein